MMKTELMGGHIHQLHQLPGFLNDGHPVSTKKNLVQISEITLYSTTAIERVGVSNEGGSVEVDGSYRPRDRPHR